MIKNQHVPCKTRLCKHGTISTGSSQFVCFLLSAFSPWESPGKYLEESLEGILEEYSGGFLEEFPGKFPEKSHRGFQEESSRWLSRGISSLIPGGIFHGDS